MDTFSPEIQSLRNDVERSVGRLIRTPSDFDWLNLRIWDTCHEYLSPTTLKRLWNYIETGHTPRRTTLCILSRLLGFADWESYLEDLRQRTEEESETFPGDGIRTDALNPGECLEIAWRPNRRAVLQYIGDNRFRVLSCENGKLRTGDTCSAACFLVNRPLFLDQLVRDNASPQTYVAGKRHGLTYVRKR